MGYRWSVFTVRYPGENEVILKNYFTGAVVKIETSSLASIDNWLSHRSDDEDTLLGVLAGENGLVVRSEKDEFLEYRQHFLDTRNNQADLFTLHLLPTMLCQFSCHCCFEKKGKKMGVMSEETLGRSLGWIKRYLEINPEVRFFKCALFGGEPLLQKDFIDLALSKLSQAVKEAGAEFWTEITTNGELLDSNIGSMLSKYDWRRVQITLDGDKEIHDRRRHGPGNRPTFDTIISNVRMLLDKKLVGKVSLRLSLDPETASSLPRLIHFLADLGYGQRIELSLGLTVPTLDNQDYRIDEETIARQVISLWEIAKECQFEIPEEFTVGPWCVAVARHSAVLQPDGNLQKCFCTVGRPFFNFANVSTPPTGYARDFRFEVPSRIDLCVAEHCPYLPVCGGGCIHDSLVKNGKDYGFQRRFCQKKLVAQVNEGLVRLNY